jgi:hypothetical protein
LHLYNNYRDYILEGIIPVGLLKSGVKVLEGVENVLIPEF